MGLHVGIEKDTENVSNKIEASVLIAKLTYLTDRHLILFFYCDVLEPSVCYWVK